MFRNARLTRKLILRKDPNAARKQKQTVTNEGKEEETENEREIKREREEKQDERGKERKRIGRRQTEKFLPFQYALRDILVALS